MKNIIASIRKSLQQENWHAALFISLAIPDICVSLEYGKATGALYSRWFNLNLRQYNKFLSGDDCYALRCSLLHQGVDSIIDQRVRDALDRCLFLVDGPHCNLFKESVLNGTKKSFLQLNVKTFCEDICIAVEKWLNKKSDVRIIQDRINNIINIYEPGYICDTVVKFGKN